MLIKSGNCPHCKTTLHLEPAGGPLSYTLCPHCENRVQLRTLKFSQYVQGESNVVQRGCPGCHTRLLIPADVESSARTKCPRCDSGFAVGELNILKDSSSSKLRTILTVVAISTAVVLFACLPISFISTLDSGTADNKENTNIVEKEEKVKGETVENTPQPEEVKPPVEEKTPAPVAEITPEPTPVPPPAPKPAPKPVAPPPPKTTTTVKACKYSCIGPDRDCADFSSHSEAQTFFKCCGFTATNDPMRLDGRYNTVDDGIACESI